MLWEFNQASELQELVCIPIPKTLTSFGLLVGQVRGSVLIREAGLTNRGFTEEI